MQAAISCLAVLTLWIIVHTVWFQNILCWRCFQTHDDREHLAMMERILGSLPYRMTKKSKFVFWISVVRNNLHTLCLETPTLASRIFDKRRLMFVDNFWQTASANFQNDVRAYLTFISGRSLLLTSFASEQQRRKWRLLRCRPTFSKSPTVSVAVSKLGCTELFYIELEVKAANTTVKFCWSSKCCQSCVALMATCLCSGKTAQLCTSSVKRKHCV